MKRHMFYGITMIIGAGGAGINLHLDNPGWAALGIGVTVLGLFGLVIDR